ncbi:MAG: hypothetical protein JNL01_03250 [Bdellovibrionales bacterium]|nr:hypothetical protein [Bdellovibrionales bacterium]
MVPGNISVAHDAFSSKKSARVILVAAVCLAEIFTAASAFADPSAEIKKQEPKAETEVKIQKPFKVFLEERPPPTKVWYGTLTLKVQPLESLVIVRDDQGAELIPDAKNPTVYSAKVLLLGKSTTFEIVRVFKDGRLQTVQIEFNYPEWYDPNGAPTPTIGNLEPPKTNVTLGPTSLVFTETGLENFSSILMTLKVANRLEIIPGTLDLGTNFFVSLFPMTKSDPLRTLRTLGINVRAGTAVYKKGPDRFSVHLGAYYLTTFTSPDFAFKDMMGPQLFPTYTRKFPWGSVTTYLKYSPVGSNVSIRPFDSREFAFGISWLRPWRKKADLLFAIDYANFKTDLVNINNQTIFYTSNSITFSGGIEF